MTGVIDGQVSRYPASGLPDVDAPRPMTGCINNLPVAVLFPAWDDCCQVDCIALRYIYFSTPPAQPTIQICTNIHTLKGFPISLSISAIIFDDISGTMISERGIPFLFSGRNAK